MNAPLFANGLTVKNGQYLSTTVETHKEKTELYTVGIPLKPTPNAAIAKLAIFTQRAINKHLHQCDIASYISKADHWSCKIKPQLLDSLSTPKPTTPTRQ